MQGAKIWNEGMEIHQMTGETDLLLQTDHCGRGNVIKSLGVADVKFMAILNIGTHRGSKQQRPAKENERGSERYDNFCPSYHQNFRSS